MAYEQVENFQVALFYAVLLSALSVQPKSIILKHLFRSRLQIYLNLSFRIAYVTVYIKIEILTYILN